MKNIEEVRHELTEIYAGLKNGTIKARDATEMNNACGKVINTLRVELEYYAMRQEKPTISFFKP